MTRITYFTALKKWNEQQNNGITCTPKKGTSAYNEVIKIFNELKRITNDKKDEIKEVKPRGRPRKVKTEEKKNEQVHTIKTKKQENKKNNHQSLVIPKKKIHIKNMLIKYMPIISNGINTGGYSDRTEWRIFVIDEDERDREIDKIMKKTRSTYAFDIAESIAKKKSYNLKFKDTHNITEKEILEKIDTDFTYENIVIIFAPSDTGSIFVEKPMSDGGGKSKKY